MARQGIRAGLVAVGVLMGVPCLTGSGLAQEARGAMLSVEGTRIRQMVACDGRDVSIRGEYVQVLLTGPCGTVRVAGARNVVALAGARALRVAGQHNVAVATGDVGGVVMEGRSNAVMAPVRAAEGGVALMEVQGIASAVRVSLRGPGRIVLRGNSHRVDWSAAEGAPEPVLERSGPAHIVRQVAPGAAMPAGPRSSVRP